MVGDRLTTQLPVADDNWDDLSEETLRNIAGGGGKANGNGNGNGGNSGGQSGRPGAQVDWEGGWSPPPGEISGRSCFFGRKQG